MTSMPAARLKLKDRGTIAVGMKADLMLFDPATIIDRSTFEQPRLPARDPSRLRQRPAGVDRRFAGRRAAGRVADVRLRSLGIPRATARSRRWPKADRLGVGCADAQSPFRSRPDRDHHRPAVWLRRPPPAQAPAAPPRGASGPPEHAKVTPINNLPNPYETVRNCGTLPDGRQVGIGQRRARRHRRQAHLGRRSLRRQLVRRIERRSDRQARSERQGRGELRRRTDPVAARHGRRQAGQRLGRRRALGHRRRS